MSPGKRATPARSRSVAARCPTSSSAQPDQSWWPRSRRSKAAHDLHAATTDRGLPHQFTPEPSRVRRVRFVAGGWFGSAPGESSPDATSCQSATIWPTLLECHSAGISPPQSRDVCVRRGRRRRCRRLPGQSVRRRYDTVGRIVDRPSSVRLRGQDGSKPLRSSRK